MQRYRVTSQSKAKASVIYSMLLDGPDWPRWMAVDSVQVVQHGAGQVGDVRRVTSGWHVGIERIIHLEQDRSFVYENVSPLFTEYVGSMILNSLPEGTSIEWTAQFTTRLAWMAWPMKLYLRRYMQRAVNKLARVAEAPTRTA